MSATPPSRSLVAENQEIQWAIELIHLGARLQLLQEETHLSRERLLRLYREVAGHSPSKGMLPYSTDWFMSWQPNIHASLFLGIYRYLDKTIALPALELLIKSYRLYLEQIAISHEEAILSVTRAWFLLRFILANMLKTTPCTRCGGQFVVHPQDLNQTFVCGICAPPSRAGKSGKRNNSSTPPP
ncbi:MAG: flagellar transcriptional regulator FlhC [Betaproteobacteria bacterium]|jgi:Flagellar transcriptional activator (FlhC).|nr:flagellar transcriptional regulator FlhC [Betaproteobacteria bacterium]